MLICNRVLLILFLLISTLAVAQKKELSLEQAYLYGYPRLTKSLPVVEPWLDKDSYLISENQKIKIITSNSEEEEVLFDFQKTNKKLPSGFELSSSVFFTKDYTKFIIPKDNDIYLVNIEDDSIVRITSDDEIEKTPTFSPDNNFIAYTKKHNLYVYDIKNKKEVKITNDGSDVVYNGYASWVYYEEILGRASRYRAFYWSPDSKKIAFLKFDDSQVPTFTLFNANGVHGELEISHYPKPGDPNPEVKLGVVDIETQKTIWLDSTVDKGNYIAWVLFTNNSEGLLYQRMNRGQDTLDIMLANLDNSQPKNIYRETQKTWVRFFEDIHLLKNKDEFLLRSEKDGWHHIYHYNLDGKLIRKITNGNWAVRDVAYVDEEKKEIYFHASKEKSVEKHLYKISFDGSGLTKLTKEAGTHSCTVLDGANYFIDKWSSIKHPPKLILHSTINNTEELIADSKLAEMDKYNLARVELFTIPTKDGYDLPAKWFLPPNFDSLKKYPVIFSVYGGPEIMTVRNVFSRRGFGNYYLAQNGIIVIQVDNRGSGHFGKKGKDELYRHLGTWEIDDLVTAAEWLRKKSFVDTNKIAITGGSYGGYTTSMALSRASKYFKYGIAKYAVTDWRLYDNIYTERFMDTPEENPEGYRYASVMTHAEDYKGGMLITHGTLDDNVHMQNTIQLIDVLEDLGKDFELMIYPNQRHGIRYPKYPHSARLDVKFWQKKLMNN